VDNRFTVRGDLISPELMDSLLSDPPFILNESEADERTRKLLIALRQAKLCEVDAIEEFLGIERTSMLRQQRKAERRAERQERRAS
jgi:hypothetical protein